MNVLCIIPARGGSKGVVDKNLRTLAGRSLVEHAALCVQGSRTINRAIVSTDSQAIALEARRCGLDVPFMRPGWLAQDDTPDQPVFVHALRWLEEHEGYEAEVVVHLRVTSPFAFRFDSASGHFVNLSRSEAVDAAVAELVGNAGIDSVRAVETTKDTPFKMWTMAESGLLSAVLPTGDHEAHNRPRQTLPTVYLQNGFVDVTRPDVILRQRSMTGARIRGLHVPGDVFVDIDSLSDLALADLVLDSRSLSSERTPPQGGGATTPRRWRPNASRVW